jgi:predicted DNA-binding transcriptional regulator YafY
MGAHSEKRDRTARLLRIQVLLGQNPDGLTIEEIARKCSTCSRTVYRDLEALESELQVPIWAKGNRRGVVESYQLPPVSFTIPEAMNITLAARLMQSHSRWYDPHQSSALMKLTSVVPLPLKKQIQNIIEWMEKQPRDNRQIKVSDKLAEAWILQHQATIRYREYSEKEPQELIIEPFYIEPSTPGNSGFVIAYSTLRKSICTYKISCIEHITIENATYTIPSDFNAMQYQSSTWEVFDNEPAEIVKLRFRPQLSRSLSSSIWNSTQVTELQEDGYSIVTLRVNNNPDFRSWVLGWGDEVEVLQPESLRNYIIRINKSTSELYHQKTN